MQRKTFLERAAALALAAILLLCGCGRAEKATDGILSALMGEEGTFPKGEIYRSNAEEGSRGYPPSAVLRAMYGEESEEAIRATDFSIYLSSFALPYEIAVVRAPSSDHAIHIYSLFLSRADTVKVALAHTDFAPLCDEILVYRSGRTVVMGVTSDKESFLKAVKGEIG